MSTEMQPDTTAASGPIARLDAWIWRRGLGPRPVRLVLRSELIFALACLAVGVALIPLGLWGLAFGIGACLMAWTFWGWARFFGSSALGAFSTAFLRAVLLGFGARLGIFFVIIYLTLGLLRAPAPGLAAGMACGLALGLISYSIGIFKTSTR